MKKQLLSCLSFIFVISTLVESQNVQPRDYRIHKRGMLWETVYNTGEIGRAYDNGSTGSEQGKPSFEWPGNSATIVDGKVYNGQYCSFGGGLYIGANTNDTTGVGPGRIYSFCGGLGDSRPATIEGVYSFPLSIERYENYPLNADGSVNYSYNPREAEEKIVAKWGTNIGITVTRTSRAWSNPDYDDFIIYEYELEHTGDRYQRDKSVVHSDSALTDVLVSFVYGLAPSMFGDERINNQWRGTDFEQKTLRARFDRRRWLLYAIDATGRPDPVHFEEWATTGKNGGGLLSPQAVGYMCLYYDTEHLARKWETQAPVTSAQDTIVWDENFRFKQPFSLRMETTMLNYSKAVQNMDILQARTKNLPYSNRAAFPDSWIGRGSFNWRQSRYFAVGRMMTFGPYILKHGDKIRFAIAEVAGFGAANHRQLLASLEDKNLYGDEGGSQGQMGIEDGARPDLYANWPLPTWDTTITYGYPSAAYGTDYLKKYKYPDYINSSTITIRDVADRAIHAYNGGEFKNYDSTYYWPEYAPAHGVYDVPPSNTPVFNIVVDSLPRNTLVWGTQIEDVMQGAFRCYEVARAPGALGPWTVLDTVTKHDPRYYNAAEDKYVFYDYTTKVGELYYYSIVTIDTMGFRSGRTNVTLHETQTVSLNNGDELGEIYVVPNPLKVRSGFAGESTPETRICFMNLPKQCTIRIYSFAGQLVNTIEHSSDTFGRAWYQITRNNQQIASGLYFFVVTTPTGKRTHGKFVVIR